MSALTFLQGGHLEPALLGLLLRDAVPLGIYEESGGEEA